MNPEKERITHETTNNSELSLLVKELLPEINAVSGNQQKITALLEQIKKHVTTNSDLKQLYPLVNKFRTLNSKTAFALHKFFIDFFSLVKPDWNLLIQLLQSSKTEIITATYNFILESCKSMLITITDEVVDIFADEFLREKSHLTEKTHVEKIRVILNYYAPYDKSFSDNPLLYLFMKHKKIQIRFFAAKLLDSDNQPIQTEIAKRFLGAKVYSQISNYITYTCASYTDLLFIKPKSTTSSILIDSIKSAERKCDEDLLKELISKLGWNRINYGIKITKLHETIFPKSLPVYISENENQFLKNITKLKTGSNVYLVRAFGGTITDDNSVNETESPVSRFRHYNLNHALVLKDILDVAPLTKTKIERILNLLDKIVKDYVSLFSLFSDECKDLPNIYNKLKEQVYREIKDVDDQPQLSTDLTRLVQMFEEPKSIYNVTTIHGLKRYLHQRGLKLGFKLVDKGKTPNRTVDLAFVVDNKISSIIKNIHYADFEPDENENEFEENVAFPIKIVARGFLSQMLYGTERFPNVNVFCYGNEIHYYVYFRNHPIFIRIDYSPPLQGGMIDLEYYGVSNYELHQHPNLELDAIKKLFQKLEFDVKMEGTRIHARYDKERTIDFGLLCEKAEYLFRMVPYMMDLDWTIGSLDYNKETKDKIIEAWTESFLQWGVFPLSSLLNNNKQKILCYKTESLESEKVEEWNGEGEYRDRFIARKDDHFLHNIKSSFNELGIDIQQFSEQNSLRAFGQVYLEKMFLWAFREAIKSGEITKNAGLFFNAANELFVRTNPIELFVNIISGKEGSLEDSVILAKFILPLERTLTFHSIGSIEHMKVQLTKISLLGKSLNLYILRNHNDIINLALFSEGNGIYKHRSFISEKWIYNWSCDVNKFSKVLRQNNYIIPFKEPKSEDISNTITELKYNLSTKIEYVRDAYLQGERIINGLSASPGRTTGKAVLGLSSRVPEDFDDSILVAETISPEDNTFLYHSAGIISTGGGILSHAGLIATQFEKPSIIIEGKWITNTGGNKSIVYNQIEYKEERKKINGMNITIMKDIHEKKYNLNDGDIIVLDANKSILEVLGQDLDTLALYNGFRTYGRMSFRIANSLDENVLPLRGKLLKARHQIEKILSRLKDPIITRFAVHEILIGDLTSGKNADFNERTNLLKIIIANPNTSEAVKSFLNNIVMEMYQQYIREYDTIIKNISTTNYLNEIIVSRLKIIHLHNLLDKIKNFLNKTNFNYKELNLRSIKELNRISLERLEYIFETRYTAAEYMLMHSKSPLKIRHIYRQLERIKSLLYLSEKKEQFIKSIQISISEAEKSLIKSLASHYIIDSKHGGLELLPLVGGKASNLAEINQICGEENISPWFAVSNKAFQDVLDNKLESTKSFIKEIPTQAKTVKDAIELILVRKDINDSQKSEYITKLWENVSLPEKLLSKVKSAYTNLLQKCESDNTQTYFAIRSSSLEEDAEVAARAGEFETFLFIDSFESIIKFLKKTWSGLWTERAIHNRKILGSDYQYKGGVIIQKIIWARVSGVMQTINVSKNNLREIIINAGLGLGEGIVSGTAASDQITVVKEGDLENSPLNFNYITADKQEQVVFDKTVGTGTRIEATLYHQRFRPALEYVEICELVKLAIKLESEYGYPLDIEYAIEGSKIWIMQVRPVATFLSAYKETVEKFPLLIKPNM
ncbi:MAG: hypothetical protein JEY94_06960 [Melioribacteraceae bacterium]|nr:hypothetical protein [Melioribacteraceae bacterium]